MNAAFQIRDKRNVEGGESIDSYYNDTEFYDDDAQASKIILTQASGINNVPMSAESTAKQMNNTVSNERPYSAPAIQSSKRSTDKSNASTADDGLTKRERLEKVLENLHSGNKKSTIKRYRTTDKNQKETEHFVVLPEGTKYRPSSAYGFKILHHQNKAKDSDAAKATENKWKAVAVPVADYREFRATSADRKMRQNDNPSTQFLLPGQKPVEDEHVFSSKRFLQTEEQLRRSITKKLEETDSVWNRRLHALLEQKVDALRILHKQEMNKLYAEFNSFKDNELFADTARDETLRRDTRYNAHILPTAEQAEYVDKHIAAQRQHNNTRCAVLTSLVRNRQHDEVEALKDTMRAPLELLKRTTDAQHEALDTATAKVKRALLHVERLVHKTSESIDPKVRLRTQRVQEQQLVIVRTAIQTLEMLLKNIDSLYDKTFMDFDPTALVRQQESEMGASTQILHSNVDTKAVRTSPPTSPKSQNRPGSPQRQESVQSSILALADMGIKKPDSVKTELHQDGSSLNRTINGYRYRTRSPPRGAIAKGVEIPDETRRPASASYLRGAMTRGANEIFNAKNHVPYSERQFRKGREGKAAAVLPGLLTTQRLLSWADVPTRPSTAPGSMGIEESPSRRESERDEPILPSPAQRPHTAKSAGSEQKVINKIKRPKSSAASTETRSPLWVIPATGADEAQGWDPTAFPTPGHADEDDDDASVGIVQDPDFGDEDDKHDLLVKKNKKQTRLQVLASSEIKQESSELSYTSEPVSIDSVLDASDAAEKKRLHRIFLTNLSKGSFKTKAEEAREAIMNWHQKHKPKVAIRDKFFRLKCEECGDSFAQENTVFLPKVGIAPEMQQRFREKQAEAQKVLLRTNSAKQNRTEQLQSKLVKTAHRVRDSFNVPMPEPPKQFCGWVCCKRYAMRTCHKSNRYNMETLIHLNAGRVIDLDTE